MDRYVLAVAGSAIALAFVSPAAARAGAHHVGHGTSAAARCAVPTRADALDAPLSGDRALEDKIEELTGVISALSDRLASLEKKLGSADDENAEDDTADDGLDLARAQGGRQRRLLHRSIHGARPAQNPTVARQNAPAA